MTKTIIVAIVAMVTGVAMGFLFCQANAKRLRRKIRAMRAAAKGTDKPKKIGVMDRVLILEAVILVAYTVADMIVFWHTGSEPSTLTACVFGVCGIENGVMGWIKTNKDQAAADARTSGRGQQAAQDEPPTQREEPPDVGL